MAWYLTNSELAIAKTTLAPDFLNFVSVSIFRYFDPLSALRFREYSLDEALYSPLIVYP